MLLSSSVRKRRRPALPVYVHCSQGHATRKEKQHPLTSDPNVHTRVVNRKQSAQTPAYVRGPGEKEENAAEITCLKYLAALWNCLLFLAGVLSSSQHGPARAGLERVQDSSGGPRFTPSNQLIGTAPRHIFTHLNDRRGERGCRIYFSSVLSWGGWRWGLSA